LQCFITIQLNIGLKENKGAIANTSISISRQRRQLMPTNETNYRIKGT